MIDNVFIYGEKQGRQELRTRWRQLLDDKYPLEPHHYLAYRLLQGLDWSKAFTPVRSLGKQKGGRWPYLSVYRAVRRIRYNRRALDCFAGIIRNDCYGELATHLESTMAYRAMVKTKPPKPRKKRGRPIDMSSWNPSVGVNPDLVKVSLPKP